MQSAIRTQELNPAKLTSLFRKQFELCRVGPGQTVAIVSDLGTRREYIQAAFAASQEIGFDIYEMCVNAIPGWTSVGVPTIGKCKGTLEALMAVDMVLIFHVPLFSKWLRDVQAKGVRVQMIIDAPDDLYQLQSPPGLKEAVVHAHKLYEKTRDVRVTSKAGTDLTYKCGEYPVMSQYGMADEPGRFDHWGVGLLHTFPNEGSAQGRVVIAPGDVVILPYCRYVQDAIELEIRDGHIVSIEGGLDAALMREWLGEGKTSENDKDPYALSHLGWGLNPQCRWDSLALYGDAPERSRAASRSFPGNFLFSTGPNTQGGGKRTTRGHYDVPMRNCTISLDGNVVVKEGRVVDPKMIVERVAR
ncbi:2,5-dihydroxypyridine 5,6-dioxygenase [Variovorax sp. Sphag1AA]|uniref:2,5-dihydroxypyridine 5,6-dioxygenase n=1 Tax=Variovorax sp. Sphag1AA TaxID=2587027 RepID=UPI00161E8FEE|nr:2,5-dihydroxypyridine 5,6-dioxygenase [Variovorax sp. Sphag1AA]MBB3176962.1 2,5-dihydroxypyridine 5,6-dioxygenase [Variovorax sp. Sphag1AA]